MSFPNNVKTLLTGFALFRKHTGNAGHSRGDNEWVKTYKLMETSLGDAGDV